MNKNAALVFYIEDSRCTNVILFLQCGDTDGLDMVGITVFLMKHDTYARIKGFNR